MTLITYTRILIIKLLFCISLKYYLDVPNLDI